MQAEKNIVKFYIVYKITRYEASEYTLSDVANDIITDES